MTQKILFFTLIWFIFAAEVSASQEKISGSNLADLIIERLNEEDLRARPLIKKSRVFTGCAEDKVVISKRDKSWKTIALTCKTNKSWNYTFRNKLAGSTGPKMSGQLSDFPVKRKKKETKLVFVLNNGKIKGDRIEESDLVLMDKKKILSYGAFSDLKLVLGKQLKKSLPKGAILKAAYLNPDWLVYKNQRIIIEHNIGEIYVKMEGIALSNGAKGDRIQAKNVSSNKTIEGFVEGAKKISIFRKVY
tara:strand:+ start:51 stop:791 length:741 start_codon:yes stop_codon:yes gene_type:complete